MDFVFFYLSSVPYLVGLGQETLQRQQPGRKCLLRQEVEQGGAQRCTSSRNPQPLSLRLSCLIPPRSSLNQPQPRSLSRGLVFTAEPHITEPWRCHPGFYTDQVVKDQPLGPRTACVVSLLQKPECLHLQDVDPIVGKKNSRRCYLHPELQAG